MWVTVNSMGQATHERRRQTVLILVTLLAIGCAQEATKPNPLPPPPPPPPPPAITYQTAVTGLDGATSFSSPAARVTVQDLVSGRPLQSVSVLRIVDDSTQLFLFVDPSERFIRTVVSSVDTIAWLSSTGLSPAAIRNAAGTLNLQVALSPANLLQGGYSTIYRLSERAEQFREMTFYDCTQENLQNLTAAAQQAIENAAQDLSLDVSGISLTTALEPILALASVKLVPVVDVAWTLKDIRDHLQDLMNSWSVDLYAAAGYTSDQLFKVCRVKPIFKLVFGHDVLVIPLSRPSMPPAASAAVAGTVRDAVTTSSVSPVTLGLNGPTSSATVSQDGAFQFKHLIGGTYSITVQRPGFAPTVTARFVVPAGGTVREDIWLAPRFLLAESLRWDPVARIGVAPSILYASAPFAGGTDVFIGTIRSETGLNPVVTDIALSRSGTLWAISYDSLYRLDATSAIATKVGSLGISGSVALEMSGSLLYGASSDGSFFRVDTLNGRGTIVGNIGTGLYPQGDLAFGPDGKLYGTVFDFLGSSLLVSIDTATGRATTIGSIGFTNVWGIAFVESALFGYTSDVSAGTGQLIRIDPATGRGTFVRNLVFNAGGASAVKRYRP